MEEQLAANRARWEVRVSDQLGSPLYDTDAFLAGQPSILPFEVDELGPLDGMSLAHLQCHLGLDTLDLARLHPTLAVTGVDFSAPAVEAARGLATQLRLGHRAEFVCADVHHSAEALAGRHFDVVYTGKGALNWLPDLDRWAEVVHQLLAPGGVLYLVEIHPVAAVLADDGPRPALDYFSAEAVPVDDRSAGALGPPAGHVGGYQWIHPLSGVLSAALRAGLVVELFHEWDFTLYQELPYLVRGRDGRSRWPGPGTLPLLYSLKARRPLR